MTDTRSAENLLEVLSELHDIEKACSVLAARLREELEAEGIALFRVDDEAGCLAHTPEVDVDSLKDVVADCVASRTLAFTSEAVALPLELEGVPVGALVGCGPADVLASLSPEAANLATILARAAGGGIPGYLSPSSFLAEIRREEERTLRSGRPFAVVSITTENYSWFPSRVIRDVCSWTRATDVCGCMKKGRIGVILPDTGFAAAHIAAHRYHDLITESDGLSVTTAFVVFPSLVGDHQSGRRFDLDRAVWTFVRPKS